MSHSERGDSGVWRKLYKLFRSLRAWSSSSLIALYFSFWLYSSSACRWAEKQKARETQRCADQEKKKGHRLKIQNWKHWFKAALIFIKKTFHNCTFQVIYGLLQLCHGPLSKLSTVLRLPRDGKRGHRPIAAAILGFRCHEHTSFSLSVMTLISSSYLSSFSEY